MKESKQSGPNQPALVAAGVGLDGTSDETRRLVHDLQVHEVQLEMQNQALRDANNLLEDSRARYAELYDNAPVAYLTLNPVGVIQTANLSASKLFSRRRDQLIGHPMRALVAASHLSRLNQHLRRCLDEAMPVTSEMSLTRLGGGKVVEIVSVPHRNPGGICTGFHVAATDVTERRLDERRRADLLAQEQTARNLAEAASAAREEFLAVASHELRTPLSPLLIWLGVLKDPAVDSLTKARAIAGIEACVKAQTAAIDDLLEMARSTSGKMGLDPQRMDLRRLIESMLDTSGVAAAMKGIEVTRSFAVSSCYLIGDEARLGQVVGNLLSNAIKFTPMGGRVDVALRREGDRYVLSVRDSGEGIEAALIPHVFERFRQRDALEARRHGGLGLGLAIVRQIVTLHDGMVWADSEGPGRGATFTVTLPALPPDDTSAQAPGGAGSFFSSSRTLLDEVNVLVLDDHPQTRDAVAVILKLYGAGVVTATSAAEGRQALAATTLHLVISDVAMPHEDGCEFMRGIRAREALQSNGRRLPAVALTAYATTESRRETRDAGFDLHLVKPVEPKELVLAVAQLVGRVAPSLQP